MYSNIRIIGSCIIGEKGSYYNINKQHKEVSVFVQKQVKANNERVKHKSNETM